MKLEPRSRTAFLIIGGVGVLIIATIGVAGRYLLPSTPTPPETEPVFCTQEAKQCPDGSYVGRTGPNCEFAACPGSPVDADWKTMTDVKTGISFRYPETLTTQYIQPTDWPPSVRPTQQPFACMQGGKQTQRGGQTSPQTINNTPYCVTAESEGAAGSTYTTYTYATPHKGASLTVSFTLRAPQCGNYDDPQKTACERERASFDVGSLADAIAQSVKIP